MLAGLGKWERLPYLISACSDDEPEVAARARWLVRDWIGGFNRSFAAPSRDDLRRAEEALVSSGRSLGPGLAELIRFHLTDW